MTKKFLPLIVAQDKELQKSWEGITSPHELAMYIARVLTVDPTSVTILQEIVYSSSEPSGEERKKIWVKTSVGIPAIGIPFSGAYKMFYPYPVNTPFIWTEGTENFPIYVSRLNSDQLEEFSLTAPTNPEYFYVIIKP